MKDLLQKTHLRALMLVVLMLCGMGTAYGEGEVIAYTIDGTITGGDNGYASVSNITQNNLNWKVTGNTLISPWRIGGKSLSKEDRTIYSTTAMPSAINKIDLIVGAASSITVNSLTLVVANDANFSSVVDQVTATFAANSTISFEPTSTDAIWPVGCFYKFTFNVTVNGTSNKFVEFKKADFYSAGTSNLEDNNLELSSTSLMLDLYNNNSVTIDYTTSSTGEVSCSTSPYVNCVVDQDAKTITVTGLKVGESTITVNQALDGNYKAGEKTFTVNVKNSDPDAPTILWSEDFYSYKATDVPTGGTFNYSCTETGTKIYEESTAGGTEPELLVSKSGGSFSATISDLQGCSGEATLSFITNQTGLKVEIKAGSSILTTTGNIKSKETTELSFTIPDNATDLTITFSMSTNTNARLDDIVLSGRPQLNYVAQIGAQKFETLQAAVDAAQQLGGEQTINLLSDISGETVTIKEVANFKLTIDGQKDASSNYTVDAVIVVDGLRGNGGSTTNGASVTLQNIAFVKTTSTDGIQASHYPHHLTIQDCTYTGFDNDKWFLNASVDGPLYGVTIKNVTVENARLIYANMAEDAVFQNITATNNVKVGFNVKTSGTALIENCQVTTGKYAFRDYTDGYEGTFTLKENTFISTSEASDEGVIVNRGGAVGTGHINVESGTYTGHVKVLSNKEGVLAITGGTFSEPVPESALAEDYICASNEDGTYIVRVGQFIAEVGGVKYESFTEAVAALTEDNNTITLLAAVEDAYTLAEGQTLNVILGENTLTVLAPEGYLLKTSVADGVTTYSYAAPVAKISDTMYASLAEAVAAVPAGEETTITMIADETIVGNAGVMIPVGKNIVLDLNGKTITLNIAEAKASQLITNRGTLTITDSSEDLTGKLTNAADKSLPVGNWPELNFATNIITNSGTLNIAGGTIQNNAKGSICYAIDNNNTSYDAILNIQGGYLTAAGTVIRQFCNSTTKQNVLNISGGSVETNGYAALWTQLPGSTGQKKLATLNITGGVIKGSSYAWYDYSDGDSFDAVNYSITGGELYGYLYSYAVANGVKPGFVTGGLFSKDVSNCCAEGLACVASEENPGMYEIGPAEVYYSWEQNGAMVGEYCTFAAPFVNDWLCDGEFITLQKNITLTEDIVCQLAEGLFTLTQGEFSIAKGDYSVSLLPNVSVLTDKQMDIFSAAEAGYVIEETEVDGGYKYTAVEVTLAAPIIFHDGGEYEGALKVAMAGQGTIKYTLNGGAEQTYSAPINVSETTTITAWTESNGVKSDEVSKTFTIAAATAGPAVEDNYYTIKNNGNNKYVNVAGRKTVTFVDETATAAGTVIRVKANDKGQVQILRSQGVDIPGYAEKAMNYVPKIVELIVDKLHAEGSGELLGENGLDAIMAKFKESFDYHLYLEEANGGYRIYGRTPSMQPVVDFYAENKANVDAKLPGLEAFINSAIEKVLQKTNGSGASILVPFSLQTVWEKMGSTLTEPVDEASTAKFYEEVLSSEANVWNFAYETAMIYWSKLKAHPKFQDNLDKLGDYAKYIDKVENIRPNFKYYIVQKNDQLDFISQGNSELNAAFTTWTLAERTDFSVAFPEENVKNAGKEHYTTLYTDFAYTLPEGVKAYKVTAINETTGVATTEEISGTIPAQTPVLLSTTNEELTQTLTLDVNDAGSAPTDNLLVGPDYLINTYNIKTEQVEGLFNMSKELLGENAYSTYLAEYEHLMLKNSGTVNNKYFFGLDEADLELCTYKNEDDVDDCVVRSLSTGDEKLGFYNNWEVKANQAFLVSDKFNPVKLTLKGDVTRDGLVNVNDVTATVDITLNKATLETHSDIYDFDAADADDSGAINVTDVIIIVNLSLGKE